MMSGLNSTGHEIGGTIGIAIFSTLAAGAGGMAGPEAASGIANAFLAAGALATIASVIALIALPTAGRFLLKLSLSPQAIPVH